MFVNCLITTTRKTAKRYYHKTLEHRWGYIAISHVCLGEFFLREIVKSIEFQASKVLIKEKKLQFLLQKDRWRKHAALKNVYKMIIFSRVLWGSSFVLRFVTWPGDVSVAVRSQARRLPISRGAVRVLKRPDQLNCWTRRNMLWMFSAI